MRLLYLILILLVIVCFLLFICNNSYEELLNYDPDTLIPDKISNSNVKRYKEKPYWPVPNLDYLEYCISNPYNKDCKRPKTKKLALKALTNVKQAAWKKCDSGILGLASGVDDDIYNRFIPRKLLKKVDGKYIWPEAVLILPPTVEIDTDANGIPIMGGGLVSKDMWNLIVSIYGTEWLSLIKSFIIDTFFSTEDRQEYIEYIDEYNLAQGKDVYEILIENNCVEEGNTSLEKLRKNNVLTCDGNSNKEFNSTALRDKLKEELIMRLIVIKLFFNYEKVIKSEENNKLTSEIDMLITKTLTGETKRHCMSSRFENFLNIAIWATTATGVGSPVGVALGIAKGVTKASKIIERQHQMKHLSKSNRIKSGLINSASFAAGLVGLDEVLNGISSGAGNNIKKLIPKSPVDMSDKFTNSREVIKDINQIMKSAGNISSEDINNGFIDTDFIKGEIEGKLNIATPEDRLLSKIDVLSHMDELSEGMNRHR